VGRGKGLAHSLPMVAVVTVIHGGGQLVLTLWNPVLSNFLAATAAMIALYPLSRWERYSDEYDGEVLVMKGRDADQPEETDDVEEHEERQRSTPPMGLAMAFLPYIVLTLTSVVALVIPPIVDAEDPYSPFTPFTHPGFFLLLSAAAAYGVFRAKGYYEQWGKQADRSDPLWVGVLEDATPASVAVVSFLVLSKVMDHSGQTDTLALGLAEVAPATVYAFFATWIGVLGAFMTSSNTASNVLFSSLQQTVADSEGLAESSIIAAQSTGGAVGNAIAPANVVLGTGTAGIVGQEGQILRKTLPWSIAVTFVVGAATVLLTQIA
jgi:lactate permease